MKNYDVFWLLLSVFIIGAMVGCAFERQQWMGECVERGLAEYSQETGDWQWKEGGE